MIRCLIKTSLTFGLLASSALGQRSGPATGSVHGVIFTVDPDGARSVLIGTKISLDGPTHVDTHGDAEGQFVFDEIPAGHYTLSAHVPGMSESQSLEVTAGQITEAELKMKIQAISQTTTVTSSAEAADTKQPSGTNILGESPIRNMPNIDEQFQTLLPLVPGVVRGPNGLIHMKGARASQNGSLVNSADVTDPATGTTAINIPIDVVSTVQVLSTPYDPKYGKFTGAVSNVETRLGDFNKFRTSAPIRTAYSDRMNWTLDSNSRTVPINQWNGP